MKFNPNQRYTRWSIRRLSVGVASVVVASGFFVLVGQPSSVRADVVNPTPAQVVPDATSVSEKSDLPVELLKEAVNTALPSEQADATPKASLDATSSPEKVNVADKDQVVAPKEEVQAKPESKKETEDAVKPATNPAPTVLGQDREANEVQPATTPAEVQKGVADNTKDTVDVPATYLDKANFPGPFTAGVNQVIPYEFFAGDGMLTRLILKASDKAPWSDNGSAKNPALPPVEKLGKGLYFYEVDLAGTQGKSDKELLDLLKQNGTQSYKATIKVYGAKDGKADLSNLVATKDLDVNLNGLTTPAEVQKGVADNTKDTVDVPASYLDKANFPGPFTAGVNQVIPYEFFAGDGMLTRLILKASDKAPWSDNGSAKNPALPPVEKLGKGLYFYEVDLAGTQGKSDKELLDLLKQNGTQSYKATIKVYGAKDGKADLSNLVATKELTVNLNGYKSLNDMKFKMPAASQDKMMPNKEQDKTMNASQPMATPSMKQDQAPAASSKMSDEGKMVSTNKELTPMMADQMKDQKDMLPYTGEAQTSMATIGFFGLALAGLLGGLGLKAKKEEND
ncbi:fibronectin-binding SSURE repeat-containing protein [Streptococcus mitis]|uniref:SSURE domain-containing protein n=1 Tax=Streptococcus mitis TaxID=28037 RepID=UPI0039C3D207